MSTAPDRILGKLPLRPWGRGFGKSCRQAGHGRSGL